MPLWFFYVATTRVCDTGLWDRSSASEHFCAKSFMIRVKVQSYGLHVLDFKLRLPLVSPRFLCVVIA